MTHAYALRKLLEHGPMTSRAIIECTGWPRSSLFGAIEVCMRAGEVCRVRPADRSAAHYGYAYALVGASKC